MKSGHCAFAHNIQTLLRRCHETVFVAIVAFMLFVPLVTFAQGEPGWSKSSLGASFEVSVPVGDFSEVAGLGYGGNVRYQYGMDNRGVFTATAGYLPGRARIWGPTLRSSQVRSTSSSAASTTSPEGSTES